MSLVCVLLKRLQEVADGGLFRCFPRTLLFCPRNYTSLCRHPTFFGRPTLSQICPTFQSDLGCSLDEIQISNSIILNWWEGIFHKKKFIGKKDQNLKMNIFSIFGRASCFYAQLPPPYVSSTTFGRLCGRREYKWPLICVCSQSQTLTLHHPQSLVGQFSKIQIRIMMILCLFPALNSHITPLTKINMDIESLIINVWPGWLLSLWI